MSSPTNIEQTKFDPAANKMQLDQTAALEANQGTRAFSSSPSDRRLSSDEWDASKVPPSRFQKRKGSIYATPGSRDGHVDRNFAQGYYSKHTEKGYDKKSATDIRP